MTVKPEDLAHAAPKLLGACEAALTLARWAHEGNLPGAQALVATLTDAIDSAYGADNPENYVPNLGGLHPTLAEALRPLFAGRGVLPWMERAAGGA